MEAQVVFQLCKRKKRSVSGLVRKKLAVWVDLGENKSQNMIHKVPKEWFQKQK